MAKFLYGMKRGLVIALFLAAAVLSSGCPLLHAVRGAPPPFPPRFAQVAEPPQDSLLLWLAADGPDTLQVDGQGRVTRWNDHRSPDRAVTAQVGFFGRVKSVLVQPPGGARREVRALSCGAQPETRCSYGLVDPTAPRGALSLDGKPYSLFAVVQRNSTRGDNYFVMTTGTGCMASAGGTGCRSNSALHLGWSGSRTARLGQYDNDAVINDTPTFLGGTPPLSLFHGFSGPIFKSIGLLETAANNVSIGGNATLLSGSGQVMGGGTPFPVIDCPDWSFDGQIVALLLYTRVLEEPLRLQAEAYLRGLYGPR